MPATQTEIGLLIQINDYVSFILDQNNRPQNTAAYTVCSCKNADLEVKGNNQNLMYSIHLSSI